MHAADDRKFANLCRKDCLISFTILMYLFMSITSRAKSDHNQRYTIPGFICNQSKQIDGVILQSSHSSLNAVSACWIRFVSDHDPWTSKRLMLKFEYFDISDHSVQLTVRGTSSGYVRLDYHSSKPSVIYSLDRYLELELFKMTSTGYNFEIIMTAYEDSFICDEFRCKNGKCIDDDLKCDEVDHCFDNSDERSCRGSDNEDGFVSFGGVAVTVVIIFVVAVFVIGCGAYKRHRRMRFFSAQSSQWPVNLQPIPPTVSTVPEPSNPVPSQGPYSAQYLPSEASYQPSSQPTNLQAPPPDYDVAVQQSAYPAEYSSQQPMQNPPSYPAATAGGTYPMQLSAAEMNV